MIFAPGCDSLSVHCSRRRHASRLLSDHYSRMQGEIIIIVVVIVIILLLIKYQIFQSI